MKSLWRVIAFSSVAAFAAACGSESKTTQEPVADKVGKCSPSEKNPTTGLTAITEKYRVVAWTDPNTSTPTTFDLIGDDPFNTETGADLTLVETAVVAPKSCEIFVGACCEPVSGITFYDKQPNGEWEYLVGHLPTISPDGELLARVAYEELLISSVEDPETTTATISLPKADAATIYRALWINGDEIALSGFTPDAAKLWIARMSDGTLREAATLSTEVTWDSGDMSRVGLLGVDESGNIVTQNISQKKHIIEFRYPDSADVFATDSLPENVQVYVMNGSRSSMVTKNGVLTAWYGNGNPTVLDGTYVWAG